MEKDGPWEVHTLTIRDIELADAGRFQVQASNRVGKSEAIGNLIVVTEPPRFPQPLEDAVQARLGTTEVFVVRVTGVPKPEVCWMKGDKELKKSKRMLLEEEPLDDNVTQYRLTIKDVEMKDFGEVIPVKLFGLTPDVGSVISETDASFRSL